MEIDNARRDPPPCAKNLENFEFQDKMFMQFDYFKSHHLNILIC